MPASPILISKTFQAQICYSEKYFDDEYEYRHVILPRDIVRLLPQDNLMTEAQWRKLGVQQSPGWIHYAVHGPEKHILLFRRPLSSSQKDKPA